MTTRTERLAAGLIALGCDRITDECFAIRDGTRQRVYWLDPQGGVRQGSMREFARKLPERAEHKLLVLGQQSMKSQNPGVPSHCCKQVETPGVDSPERFFKGVALALVLSVPLWTGIGMALHWVLA